MVAYNRIVKSLDELSQQQLIDLSDEIEQRISHKKPSTVKSSEYNQGWKAAFDFMYKYIDPITRELQAANFIAGMIHGEALGGVGNLAIEQMKELASLLLSWMDRVDTSIKRANRIYPSVAQIFGIEGLSEVYKAAKAYATGDDSKGQILRQLVEDKNPVLYKMMQLRLEGGLKQGADSQPVIDRLCIRAKIYRDQGYTWDDVYQTIITDLASPKNKLEQEEHDKLWRNGIDEQGNPKIWGVGNLKKAFVARYPMPLISDELE